jgi:two-component system, OmpR family, response regulator CpxR
MAIISIFSGIFCREEPIVSDLIAETGNRLIRDADIVYEASHISGIGREKIERAFSSRTSVFNKFTHERERSIAHLKLALAKELTEKNLVIEGFISQLIPDAVNHVLRVCLIADMKSRVSMATKDESMAENEAIKLIRKTDGDRSAWIERIWELNDPWDPSIYDIIIPTDKMENDEINGLIRKNLDNEALNFTDQTKRAMEDFILSATVEATLAGEGHNVSVEARNGEIILTINKHVLMLTRLEEELKAITKQIPGVKDVVTKVGPGFHQTDIYRKYDFEIPSKVLLVDDEREFVQTLSERLLMRDMGSVVAYDGESALELINEDEPEVMILDLRMPGIDGIEVLKRVKQTQPDIEIIILTGHGSDADRETCMKLGAFAYLQKPVDIDALSETIKSANEKIQQKRISPEQ